MPFCNYSGHISSTIIRSVSLCRTGRSLAKCASVADKWLNVCKWTFLKALSTFFFAGKRGYVMHIQDISPFALGWPSLCICVSMVSSGYVELN